MINRRGVYTTAKGISRLEEGDPEKHLPLSSRTEASECARRISVQTRSDGGSTFYVYAPQGARDPVFQCTELVDTLRGHLAEVGINATHVAQRSLLIGCSDLEGDSSIPLCA
jgi:hypothetical protein